MPTIKTDSFAGIVPKVHPTLIPDACATRAHNCVLKNGKLVPLRMPSKVTDMRIRMENGLTRIADARSIYLWHRGATDELLAWGGDVRVAESNLSVDEYHRLFVTGDTGVGNTGYEPCVYMASASGAGIVRYSLVKDVMPAPVVTTTAVPEDEDNKKYTFFFQSWVDSYGYESGASLPSEEIVYLDGALVTVAGTPAPSSLAVKRRIYKVLAVNETGMIQFVAEQEAVGTTFPAYTFRLLDADAGETMPVLVSPPSDLMWMTMVPGNFYAGFSRSNRREVRFSEMSMPSNWPELYSYGVNSDIVGLGVTLNSVFVLTKGMPWVVTGTDPDTMTATMLASEQGCVSARSICVMEGSVFYASADGVCMLTDGSANATVVTKEIFSKREWADLKPESCIMCAYDNALQMWFADNPGAGGYIINFSDGQAAVTTNDEFAKALCTDTGTDKLYFVREV